MDKIKKGLAIFAFFFKIGCFTFGGGWAILAQMEQEFVNKRQVITKAELLEMEVKQLMGVSIDDTDATEDPDDFTAKSGLLWENEDETLKWPQQKSSIWDEQ